MDRHLQKKKAATTSEFPNVNLPLHSHQDVWGTGRIVDVDFRSYNNSEKIPS